MRNSSDATRPLELAGHVALVTGGNGGIGLGMAFALAEAGADVVIWGTNPTKNRSAVKRLEATGRRVFATVCDVRREDDVAGAFAEAVKALGKVDSVFANAGVRGTSRTPFVDADFDEWRQVVEVNLDGAFLTLREGARHLVDRGEGGALVAVSSMAARFGTPGYPAYGTTKTALLGLVRTLAAELARYGIRCNALLPGWTVTDMTASSLTDPRFVENTTHRTPVRRWAEPPEFGPVAVYLANPQNTFHTGDALVVDGGYTVS